MALGSYGTIRPSDVSPEDVDPDADYQAAEADGNLIEFTAEGPQSVTAAQAQADADRAQPREARLFRRAARYSTSIVRSCHAERL